MSQKALLLQEARGRFEVGTRPIPKPGPGELLVKIQATALNPSDWKIQELDVLVSEYPAVLGSDSAGIVEEVGEGVTGFAKGDAVFHEGDLKKNDYATFQQYTLVPAEIVAKKPASISFEEAASIPLALAVAAQVLYGDRKRPDLFKLAPAWEAGGEQAARGKTILVLGGSSSVGQLAIQLARLSGFSSIISTASLHNTSLLKSLGATSVVDRYAPDVKGDVSNADGGSQIDFVFDTIGTDDTQNLGWDILASGGTFVSVQVPRIDREKYPDKNVVDGIFGNVHYPHLRSLGVSLYKALPGLIESGKILPNPIEVLPNGLNGIIEGLARMKANKISGMKLIARPQEAS